MARHRSRGGSSSDKGKSLGRTSSGGEVSKRGGSKGFSSKKSDDMRHLLRKSSKKSVIELAEDVNPRFIGRLEPKSGPSSSNHPSAKAPLVTKSYLEKQTALLKKSSSVSSAKPKKQSRPPSLDAMDVDQEQKKPKMRRDESSKSLTITIVNDAVSRAKRNPVFELPPPLSSSKNAPSETPSTANYSVQSSNPVMVPSSQSHSNWIPRHIPMTTTNNSIATSSSTGHAMLVAATHRAPTTIPVSMASSSSNTTLLRAQAPSVQLVSTPVHSVPVMRHQPINTRTVPFMSLAGASSSNTNAHFHAQQQQPQPVASTPSLTLASRFSQMYS